jgi:glycosyltransferase involved in cell wall biosynthesis
MINPHPLVSVVIPVYNGSNFLKEAVDSVLCQTYANIEILIINDGSNDNGATERIALSYGGRVRYFKKANGGVASALNMGIRNMRGEYFSWLSHDDKYFPEKIESQIAMLYDMGKPYELIFSGWSLIDKDGKETHRILPFEKYTKEELKRPLFPLLHGLVGGCCLLIHKSYFESLGMFDEHLPFTQDYDLWFRFMRGRKAICFPYALTMVRVHDGQGGRVHKDLYSRENDALWLRILKSLTPREMQEAAGSEYLFFKDVYVNLSLYSPCKEAVHYAKAQMIAALNNSRKDMGLFTFMLERLSLVGLIYKAAIKELLTSLMKNGAADTLRRVKRAFNRIT